MSNPGVSVLAPLRVRDYRLQWPADLFTAWAFEMEVMLLGWFVLTTSNSVFLMSVIGAMPFIGTLLAPVVGMIGDRIGLRNLLCLMRAFYLANALALLAFALTGNLTIPIALAIAAMTGLVRPSDIGVRTALVANTVSAGILPNAMGLSRTTFDSARIFGALSGAGLFAVFGLGMAYVLVVTCYAVGLILTLMISRPPRATPPSGAEVTRPSPLRDLMEGFGYVVRTPKVLAGMCLACLVNFTAFPFSIGLMPYVARNVLAGDETTLGYLLASFAGGALAGSVFLIFWRNQTAPSRMMIIWAVIWHLFLIAFAQSQSLPYAMAMQFGAGLSQSLSMVSLALMLLQTADVHLRGRVMGVRMMAIYSLPLGLMSAGALIQQFGFSAVATAYIAMGLLVTIVIAVIWNRSVWRTPARSGA